MSAMLINNKKAFFTEHEGIYDNNQTRVLMEARVSFSRLCVANGSGNPVLTLASSYEEHIYIIDCMNSLSCKS